MIKVLDSLMGTGKTSYVIQEMNANPERKYVYITPYLDEVQRIKESCINFEDPESNLKTGELKIDSLNQLLAQGKNVVSTHALFKLTTKQTIDALKKWDYTLIIDEVMEVVSNDDFRKDDLPTILAAKLAHIDETTGYLVWDKDDFDGAYNKIKRLCKTRSVIVIDNVALVWVFPATIFQCFKDTYICTYMFNCQIQRFYFDMHKIDYEVYSVVDVGSRQYELKEYTEHEDRSNIKINILTGKKNDIGSAYSSLSANWYDRASREELKRIKDNLVGFFKNDLNRSPSDLNLWTAFKKNQKDLAASPYTKGFLSCNARATNSYKHKKAIAYVINKFLNPYIIKFFKIHAIDINREYQVKYALSELLQFLFRSAIREGHEIYLYIPSKRMRYALQDWLGVPNSD
ncbi:conserved hypothetical protein [uncultured Sporomusa sp.]|uniref:Uncharacterized protein n=1 Tax=uncultured Sporomusa sp. TaxID=307249 RepID=A0A212M1U9_9FIRM|nr:hypothetical protein [uncultured Sporomusa sp.]SCM83736.1 conserved hypothetical protein [uncultured Sporomusa sp.]